MKALLPVFTLLLIIMITSVSFAAPTFTNVSTANVGANMTSLKLRTSEAATGYFTLLTGSNIDCGTSDQVKSGKTATDTNAPYFGSLQLIANTIGSYTVRNLTSSTTYTACFTAAPTPAPEIATLNLTTGTATSFISPGWNAIGGAGFSTGYAHFTSLAFAADGTPYLAYVDANNSYMITVVKYNGSTWELIGTPGFANGTANHASLGFAQDGTLNLAYIDSGSSQASVMQYNGSSWNLLGTPAFLADTNAASLAFAPDGTPYVAYIDGSDSRAAVMKFSAGGWNALGNAGLSPSGAWFSSLAIAPNGATYLAYSDYGNSGKATVMEFTGSDWIPVGSAGFSAGTAANTSLAIAPDNTLYLAYQDGGSGNRATVMKFSGTAWAPVGDAGFSTGTATNTSLAIAPNGVPYVAYQDGASSARATVAKYNGTAWLPVGSSGFSTGTASSPALAFAPDGTPYLAYGDDGNGSRATVMKLTDVAPTISGDPPATVAVDAAYNFTPTATNADSFAISNKPIWASFDPNSGRLSGTPTEADIGTYSGIVISATNSVDSTELPLFSIEVIAAPANGSVRIGSTLYATLGAALAVANDGDSVELLASIPLEGVNYSGIGVNTLAGGFDVNWTRQPSLFSPVSSITITSGTLIIDRIAVQ